MQLMKSDNNRKTFIFIRIFMQNSLRYHNCLFWMVIHYIRKERMTLSFYFEFFLSLEQNVIKWYALLDRHIVCHSKYFSTEWLALSTVLVEDMNTLKIDTSLHLTHIYNNWIYVCVCLHIFIYNYNLHKEKRKFSRWIIHAARLQQT